VTDGSVEVGWSSTDDPHAATPKANMNTITANHAAFFMSRLLDLG
jgi:hypothetical protein